MTSKYIETHHISNLAKYRQHQSHFYKSHAGKHFYGTENDIWAGFEPVGNSEKKNGGRLLATFEGVLFMFSGAKKKFDSCLKLSKVASDEGEKTKKHFKI